MSVEPAERQNQLLWPSPSLFSFILKLNDLFLLPFDINVAHLLPADADIIQDDITGVPDDATQEEPEKKRFNYLRYWLTCFGYQNGKWICLSWHICVFVFLLFGLSWRDVERRSRWSQRLGEEVNPHHQTPLTESTDKQTKGKKMLRKKKAGKDETEKNLSTHTSAVCVCVLPALCQVGAGCRVVCFPHVRVPIPVSSRCEGTVAP